MRNPTHDFRYTLSRTSIEFKFGLLVALGGLLGAGLGAFLAGIFIMAPLELFGVNVNENLLSLLAAAPGVIWGIGAFALSTNNVYGDDLSKLEAEALSRWNSKARQRKAS